MILAVTLLLQGIKLVLGYILIFGWGTWIPSLGILGGAISTLIAQVVFCGVLLKDFLSVKNAQEFNTRMWRFQLKVFWECIYPGLLRVCNRVLNFTSWASIAHIMTAKGGDYLLALSIGGTLFLFLPMFVDALCQAQITVVSNLLGTQNFFFLKKASRSGLILVACIVIFTSIPLIFFANLTCNYLFPDLSLEPESIRRIFFGVWLSFLCLAFSFIPISDVLAFKDMKFSVLMGIFNWMNGYLFMKFMLNNLEIRADQFWLALSVMHATTGLVYFWRASQLRSNVSKKTQCPAV